MLKEFMISNKTGDFIELNGFRVLMSVGHACHLTVLWDSWVGVQKFFILSGYLISAILSHDRDQSPSMILLDEHLIIL